MHNEVKDYCAMHNGLLTRFDYRSTFLRLVPKADLVRPYRKAIGFFRRDPSEARNYWFLVRQSVIVNVEIWIEDGLALRAEEGRLRLDPFAGLLLFRVSHQTCL